MGIPNSRILAPPLLHICPSPPRPCQRRCCQVTDTALPLASGRRAVALAGIAAWLATAVGRADAASPLDKYVKRKKLEPLETYVPAVLLTIDQFVDLGNSQLISRVISIPQYHLNWYHFGQRWLMHGK